VRKGKLLKHCPMYVPSFSGSLPTNVNKSIKLLEENISSNFFDISHRNIFLDMFPQARETKPNQAVGTTPKIKSFCTAKETINKTK